MPPASMKRPPAEPSARLKSGEHLVSFDSLALDLTRLPSNVAPYFSFKILCALLTSSVDTSSTGPGKASTICLRRPLEVQTAAENETEPVADLHLFEVVRRYDDGGVGGHQPARERPRTRGG